MNIIDQFEKDQINALGKEIPAFAPGDTLRIHVKVTEGNRERVQIFEGVCIARKNAGLNGNFTVRKISYGEGVERVFPLYSPTIERIELVRRGDVRRAKLYYLRERRGKSARIAEKNDWTAKGASTKEASHIVAAPSKPAKPEEKAPAQKAAPDVDETVVASDVKKTDAPMKAQTA